MAVTLLSPVSATMLFRIFPMSSCLNGITSSTTMLPSVRVPVLSRQRVSTLASVSTQYRSCARALCLASLITLTQKMALVRVTSPLGIIPRRLPITERTVSLRSFPWIKYFTQIRATPRGIIIIPISLINLSKLRLISDGKSFMYFAPLLILVA